MDCSKMDIYFFATEGTEITQWIYFSPCVLCALCGCIFISPVQSFRCAILGNLLFRPVSDFQ